MKKIFLSVCLFLLIFQVKSTVREKYYDSLYYAFVSGKMVVWERALNRMEKEYDRTGRSDYLFDILHGQYGYIAYCLGVEDEEKAEDLLDRAEKNLAALINSYKDQSSVYAIKGALLAFKIAMDNYKAVYLGPRSESAIKKAVEINPQNPVAWVETGNMQFYLPSFLGGSKEKAIESYKRSLELMKSSSAFFRYKWMYLNVQTAIARGYEEMGEFSEADLWYRKILEQEPEFRWVKDELYPEFLGKQKSRPE